MKTKAEVKLKINSDGIKEELSQLNTLLKEANELIDSISSKFKNLTVVRDNKH